MKIAGGNFHLLQLSLFHAGSRGWLALKRPPATSLATQAEPLAGIVLAVTDSIASLALSETDKAVHRIPRAATQA